MSRYYINISHHKLNKHQTIRGNDKETVEYKARIKLAEWDEMWARKVAANEARLQREQRAQAKEQKLALAAERTRDAQTENAVLTGILSQAIKLKYAIDWEALKDKNDYGVTKPVEPKEPREPKQSELRFQPKLGFVDQLIQSRATQKRRESIALFRKAYSDWLEAKERLKSQHLQAISQWEQARDEYIRKRDEKNADIDSKRAIFWAGETDAIIDYFDTILSKSKYPDYFPQTFELDYQPSVKRLIIDYQLPDLALIPTLREVRYIQTRDEFTETHLTATQINKLYDELLYQITLRTLHEIFEADTPNTITSVVFNGYVTSIDPATGQEITACILSIQTTRQEFKVINLANVAPKVCFKSLKGISASALHSLTPIAPVIRIDREDGRFIQSYGVVDSIDENQNLAAMNWEDFEHLVREVFEKEFAVSGGEVKVTRASRDGGVDAVAFDPDPIRGGKIVIQAKRYTNTVDVSAVRDLFGSVMNEGATKGILVTTSDYGPDAYEFARGKPLTLLNGNNLLHILEKHGYRARIDIKEAKRTLAEKG